MRRIYFCTCALFVRRWCFGHFKSWNTFSRRLAIFYEHFTRLTWRRARSSQTVEEEYVKISSRTREKSRRKPAFHSTTLGSWATLANWVILRCIAAGQEEVVGKLHALTNFLSSHRQNFSRSGPLSCVCVYDDNRCRWMKTEMWSN